VAALAATVRAEPAAGRPAGGTLAAVLPLPLSAAAALAYVLFVFLPITACAGYLAEARRYAEAWPAELKAIQEAPGANQKRAAAYRATSYLQTHVLKPLHSAAGQDPTDAEPWVELAQWYGEEWKLLPQKEIRFKAAGAADQAIRLDPEGKEGYLAKYRLNLMFAQSADQETKALYALAAGALRQVVKRDPTEARYRYELADVLFRAGDPAGGRAQAAAALEYDGLSSDPARQLTDAQKREARQWADSLPPG
jgi:hypothetical protein